MRSQTNNVSSRSNLYDTRRHLSIRTSDQNAVAWPQPEDLEEPQISRAEYTDLVDTYEPSTTRKYQEKIIPQHYPLAPRLLISPEEEERSQPVGRHILSPINEEHRRKLKAFKDIILKLPPGQGLKRVVKSFEALPEPRLRYLHDGPVFKLFRHFTWVETRDYQSCHRYLALLDEAIRERVPLKSQQWTAAISFVGRWVRHTSTEEVQAAIEMWLRMEREGGISANNITFNILFDLAVKAERFALADTIVAEMERRGMELNRYFWSSKIYYAGRRGDGEGVRAAFRELVAAGEIVDTKIMNCVIVSLVRSGEIASAEHVLGKMKQLHAQKYGADSIQHWREQKKMGRKLEAQAHELREDTKRNLSSFFGTPYSNEDKKEEIQRAAPIAPDELSYRILIQWHARFSGNLDRIREFIAEIDGQGWTIKYSVYYHLFMGFHRHGGYAYSAWTRQNLEDYWKDYLDSVVEGAAEQEISKRMNARIDEALISPSDIAHQEPGDALDTVVEEADHDDGALDDDDESLPSHLAPNTFRSAAVISALVAFYQCAGARRMMEVWDEVQVKWTEMDDRDRRRIGDIVAEKCREAAIYVDP